MLKNLWRKDRKFRYLLIGGVNTVVGLSVYPLLYLILNPALGYFEILIASQSICIGFAYISTKKLVFRTQGGWGNEISRFLTFHGIVLAVNMFTLPILVGVIGFAPIIGQTLFSVLVMVLSYIWHSQITFRKKKIV